MSTEKIKIESHGISPWHYHLENMSWGFCRGKGEDDDIMAYLNIDKKLANGGQGIEDILMADFLNALSFMPVSFMNEILSAASGGAKPELDKNAEVRGNAGNYYIPYEDEKNGIKLAQPDGWISDGKNLFLLEAKGYRNTAALNKGQLAKEYLIAKNVAYHTEHENFYILLIAAKDFENIYRSGKESYSLTQDKFKKLWDANVSDLNESFGKELNEKMSVTDWQKNIADNVAAHFLWITWEQIREIAALRKDDPKAKQIVTAIDFHSKTSDKKPIFSQLLAELAQKKEPLYKFFNGGCGNATVIAYEKTFLDTIGKTDSPQAERWKMWHQLAEDKNELIRELEVLENERREAVAQLKDAQKKIKGYYERNIQNISPRNTARKAFEMLGESSQLENGSEFFEQRYKVCSPKK